MLIFCEWGGYFHKDIIFRKGTFFDIEEDEISALIMVNFITNISPESLKGYLDAVRKKNKVDVVVFDTYEKDPSIRAYHFVHDGNFILPGFRLLHKSKGFSTASGAVRYVEYWISEDDV